MPSSADTYRNRPEHELQHGYHLHDRLAFAELWQRHERLFYGVAHNHNSRLAEDGVSQLKTQLADPKTQDSYQPDLPWRNWAVGILRKLLISLWRTWDKRRATSEVLDSLAGTLVSAADTVEHAELAAALHNCMERLPADLRQVLTLYFLQELGVEDVAKQCAISNGTVSKRKKRALQALRECLQGSPNVEAE